MTDAEDEPLDLTEDMQIDPEEQDDAPEQDEDVYSITLEGDDEDEDEREILALPEEHRGLPSKLREKLQTAQRDKFALEKRLSALEQAGSAPVKIEVGDEPTLEGCEWDEDKFKAEWRGWNERKTQAGNAEADAKRASEARDAEWRGYEDKYRAKKASLRVSQETKDAAEQSIIAAFPAHMQGAMIRYADDPAKVMLALHQNPRALERLSKESDPLLLMRQIWKMEETLTTKNSKRKPAEPESRTVQRGSAPMGAGGGEKERAKLLKEARDTGNRTKLIAFDVAQREKAK